MLLSRCGVGITTTLNTAITVDTNTVVLASATNFPQVVQCL